MPICLCHSTFLMLNEKSLHINSVIGVLKIFSLLKTMHRENTGMWLSKILIITTVSGYRRMKIKNPVQILSPSSREKRKLIFTYDVYIHIQRQ